MKKIFAVLSAGLMIVSCAPSTPQTRIQQSPEKFATLSSKHKELVRQGRIDRGMSQDAVYLAWGSPSRSYQGSKGGKATERWDYTDSQPVYTSNFYGSFGRRYYGPYYGPYRYSAIGFGPEITYVPYRSATVWFINHRVDSWERVR